MKSVVIHSQKLILKFTIKYKNGIILIEEPERGLNPKAIAELIEFFRERSELFNIFVNTHSESIVRVTQPKELFLVDVPCIES